MKNSRLIPKNKEDLDFINELKPRTIIEIKDIIPDLLEWIQDMNWPQAKLLVDYFSPHINEIDVEIINVLEGDDSLWKYSILLGLILNSKSIPNDNILSTIRNICKNPSEDDKEEEVNILAEEIIKKYGNETN